MIKLSHQETMSSREIAHITGKAHNDLLKAIREMENAWENITGGKFSLSEYKDSTGRKLPEYQLNKIECLYVATKFNNEARARLIIRWAELEEKEHKQKIEEPKYKKGEHFIINQVKEQRFELVCLIRQYMKRGDMANTAKELGYNPSSVQDVMLGRQWNESIIKAMYQKAMQNKEQSLFDVRGMIEELKKIKPIDMKILDKISLTHHKLGSNKEEITTFHYFLGWHFWTSKKTQEIKPEQEWESLKQGVDGHLVVDEQSEYLGIV